MVSTESAPSGECVLIVEDDATGRAACETLLRQLGYSVTAVENGAAAVRAARELRPRIVLMDLRMPVMDGWTAAEILKATTATSRIPILAVTAEEIAEKDRSRFAELFAGWTRKPVAVPQLLSEIGRILGEDATRADGDGSGASTAVLQ